MTGISRRGLLAGALAAPAAVVIGPASAEVPRAAIDWQKICVDQHLRSMEVAKILERGMDITGRGWWRSALPGGFSPIIDWREVSDWGSALADPAGGGA